MHLIPFFGRVWEDEPDWRALGRGPYGEELVHQAWLLYESLSQKLVPGASEPFLTFALLSADRMPGPDPTTELRRLLNSKLREEAARGLAACAGMLWGGGRSFGRSETWAVIPIEDIARHMFSNDPSLWTLAVWAWGLYRGDPGEPGKQRHLPHPSKEILDRLAELFLSDVPPTAVDMAAFGVVKALYRLPRHSWQPKVEAAQRQKLRQPERHEPDLEGYLTAASLLISFHAGDIWTEEELASRLARMDGTFRPDWDAATFMLEQMGEVGQKHLRSRRRAAPGSQAGSAS